VALFIQKMLSKMKKFTLQNTFYRLGLILLPLFSALNTHAQTKQKWFRQEYGNAQSAVFDNGHSLAKHTGNVGIQLNIGGETDRPKSYSKLDNIVLWTPLSTNVANDKYSTSAQQGNIRISYSYLRKLPKTQDKAVKIAVGGSFYTDANLRIYTSLSNNVFGWDANIGLNVMGRAQHDFTFKNRSLSVSYQLGLPILTYNHAPNYLGNFPISGGFEDKGGVNYNFGSLGRFVAGVNSDYFYLNQQISLDKINATGNRFRLSYSWQYANNSYATHRYQNILNGFTFGILTNISHKTTALK
jgi:hypothetical protein